MHHPLNIFFNKIYIISIKRNKQRLDTFMENHPGLDVEIFPGIDGTELYPLIENVCSFPLNFFTDNQLLYSRCQIWNKGQLGCAMSNLLVQKEIIKHKLQKVLILEDDAYLLSEQILYFNLAIKQLPPDWELFYLGYNPITKWSENSLRRILFRIRNILKPLAFEKMSSGNPVKHFLTSSYSRYLNIPGIYTGTHAYALSYEGAKKIVEIDTPLQHGFDTTLMYANYHKLIKGFSLKKPLFIPNQQFVTSLIN